MTQIIDYPLPFGDRIIPDVPCSMLCIAVCYVKLILNTC